MDRLDRVEKAIIAITVVAVIALGATYASEARQKNAFDAKCAAKTGVLFESRTMLFCLPRHLFLEIEDF